MAGHLAWLQFYFILNKFLYANTDDSDQTQFRATAQDQTPHSTVSVFVKAPRFHKKERTVVRHKCNIST